MSKLKHVLRTKMFLGSGWLDVTDQVLVRDRIKITDGRSSGSTENAPLTATFSLRNQDLQWSQDNPLSPYYEDLQRNVPVTIEALRAWDDFDRTSSAGPGASPSEHVWAMTGAGGTVSTSDITCSGGVMRISVPATSANRTAYLLGVSQLNQVAECTFQLPTSNVTGGDLEPANLMLRYSPTATATHYMIRVVVTAADAVTVAVIATVNGTPTTIQAATATGLTNTGQRFRVKALVEGQTVRAKVWEEVSGEPLDYTVSVRDGSVSTAGTIGIRCGVASGNTNTLPIVYAIDDFALLSPRFRGEISSFALQDNEKGTDRVAKCQAAGIMRRLGQGTAPTTSSLKRGYLSIGPTLVAYWPAEDGDSATEIASAIGGFPMNTVGDPQYASNDDFASSRPIPTLGGSGWFGDVPNYGSTGEAQLRFLLSIPDSGATDDTIIARIGCGGTATLWEVVYLTGGGLKIKAYDINGINVHDSGAIGFALNGIPVRLSFELENSGANVNYRIAALSAEPGAIGGFTDGTVVGYNFGEVFQVQIGPQGVLDNVAVGHISLESERTDLFANVREMQAWFDEDVIARTRRVCAENGIPFTHSESAAQDGSLMGYQRPLRLVELLRESPNTDGGVLHEPRGAFGLEYRTRRGSVAQSARLVVDVAAKQVGHPFRPTSDDQLTRNDVTAEQPDGSSARAELTAGPMSTQDYPDGIGRVDAVYPVNISTAALLPNHAEWRLALGTEKAPRTPDVKMAADAPEVAALLDPLLDLRLNDRITYTNAGERTGYFDPIDQLLVGITEEWTNHTAVFYLNGVPYGPYAVGVAGGDARLDSDSSTLSGALSADSTGTFSVATSNPADLWITTATHQPDVYGDNHFPVDVMIGGERITISAITGSSSPQTFTVAARGVNGVKQPGHVGKAHASGTGVHVYEPFRFGL